MCGRCARLAGLTANAGQDAIGRLEVLARAGVPANGPHGQDAMMLASLRERLRASRAAEAAARRSAAGMARHLAQTCLQLRQPASIVRGYAGYLRQQHEPQPSQPRPDAAPGHRGNHPDGNARRRTAHALSR